MLLGSFVYLRGRKNAVNISFIILTSTIALWSFGVFMIVSVWRNSNPIFWVRITYALGTFMATAFAVFSFIFPDGQLRVAKRYIRYMCPVAAALAVVSLSPLSIREIIFENGVIIGTHYGIGNALWAMYVVVCLILAFYYLGRKWRRGSGIKRLQVQYVFLGILLTTTFIALTNIFIPLLLGYEYAGAYGPCFTMIMVGNIAYAIVKHRLMDIRVLIKKGVIYSFLLASATLGVGLLVIGVPHAFPDLSGGQSAIVSLLGGLFIVFVLRPFSYNLKELINALIFKGQYHSRRVLSNFTRSVAGMLDLEELLNLIFNTAVEITEVDRASLWLLDHGAGVYRSVLLLGLKPDDLQVNLSTGSRIVSYLENIRAPIVKEELERGLPLEDFDKIETDFRRLKAEISLPLFAEDQMIGILNLGSKSSGRIYFEEDLNLLKDVSDQSSIAIQNARLHQQVVNMKNYNETILENLTSGVIAIDLSCRINTANRAAARILGVEVDDIVSTDISHLPKYIQDPLVRTLRNGSGFRDLEIAITAADKKEEKTILISTTILEDEKQQPTGAVAVFSDISDLKAIEKEIRQTEKFSSLGRLAAELAHEIKNPLLTIRTFFELLTEHQQTEGLDGDFLNLALSETDRINELIRRLLDLTRPAPPKFTWCNINRILDETLLILENDITDRNIELMDLRSDSLTEIYADENQLKQAFLNLGLNALDAMENGGKLTIETLTRSGSRQLISRLRSSDQRSAEDLLMDFVSDSVVVKIADTGVGMSEHALDKIFEPFYTTKNAGTGLGLTVVRNIIREHKGVIAVDSHEQIGTIFTIELPSIGEKAEMMRWSEANASQ
jgi:PAS domain S-box-containing protein